MDRVLYMVVRMKYLVRQNPKAVNVLTGKLDVSRQWEVEQAANKDSERVIWHCQDVMIGDKTLTEIISDRTVLRVGTDAAVQQKVELVFYGIAIRGQNNAIVIDERKHEVI